MVQRFRGLPVGRKARLAAAQLLEGSDTRIGDLADCLASSISAFDKGYGATAEPFHPPRPKVKAGSRLDLDRADNLALRLSGVWLVENDEQLDFVYLDREVPIAHRRKHPRIDDDLTVDLLLANARDGTPIVGEVKRADPADPLNADADPYYALMQSLAAVSMLATTSQLKRLQLHTPLSEYGVNTDGRVDIYLMALNTAKGTAMEELSSVVGEIARKLLAHPATVSPLRRIALLDLAETPERTLRITRRWVHEATDEDTGASGSAPEGGT
jgi:hypothetical protein